MKIAKEPDAEGGVAWHSCDMSKRGPKRETKRDPELVSAGERLEAARLYLYPTVPQWKFAEGFGVVPSTFNNWANGKAPIPRDFVERIKAMHPKFGLGWFWYAEIPDDEGFRAFLLDRGLISFTSKR